MQTLAALFDDYRRHVLPPTAPPIQIDECRRAFFAGAAAVITEIQHIPDDVSDEEHEAQVLTVLEEVRAFAATQEAQG